MIGSRRTSIKEPGTSNELRLGVSQCSKVKKPSLKCTNVSVRNRIEKKTSEEKSGLVPVSLHGTIPDVIRWVRERMDDQIEQARVSKDKEQGNDTVALNAKAFAQTIPTNYKVKISLDLTDSWKGDTRFWGNVCSYAAKLPDNGKARCIFDSMSRYPASILVYYGLKPLFGRNVVIIGRKIPRVALRQNALTVFSSHASEDSFAKKWFESNTLPRMQELIIHMSGIAEYVMRCVYIAKKMGTDQSDSQEKFLSLLEKRIRERQDHLHRTTLFFEPRGSLIELFPHHIGPCLESSLNIAHDAVIDGAKRSVRQYCQKEGGGKARQKLKLWMMKRPLPEVMDCLIQNLEVNVCEVLGSGLDRDVFRLRIVRHLRRIEKIYKEVGETWFRNENNYATPLEQPKKVKFLTSCDPYSFLFVRK